MGGKSLVLRPSIGLFPIFLLVLSGIGLSVLIGIIALCVSNRHKIKRRGKELLKAFLAYEIKETSWWVKFIKTAKIPGLKDAIKPGLHVCKRIIWFLFVTICFGFGVVWIIHLSKQISATPTKLVYSEEKVNSSRVPFPEIISGLNGNFKNTKIEDLRRTFKLSARHGEAVDSGGITWTDDVAGKGLVLTNHLCNSKIRDEKWSYRKSAKPPFPDFEGFFEDPILEPMSQEGLDSSEIKISNFLQSARESCSSVMKACSWGGQEIDCADAFVEVQTDLGAGCAFNKMPSLELRKHKTWQTQLTTEKVCKDDDDEWHKYDIDKDLLSPEPKWRNKFCINKTKSYQKTIPLTQAAPGQHFGFSYVIQFDNVNLTCLQLTKGLGHFLEINSIMDDSNMLRNGLMLPHNHDVYITLEAVVIISDKDIRWFSAEHRNCFFTNEATKLLKYYKRYTEENCLKECLSKEIQKQCECGLIAQPNAPGTRLCTTTENLDCAKGVQKSIIPCPQCLPGCTDLKYRVTELSMVPYNADTAPDIVKHSVEPGKPSTSVHISFKQGYFIIHKRKLAYDWAELLGLIGGTISLTNGFSFIDGGRMFDASYQFLRDRWTAVVQYFAGLFIAYGGWLWLRTKNKDGGESEDKDLVESFTQDDTDQPQHLHINIENVAEDDEVLGVANVTAADQNETLEPTMQQSEMDQPTESFLKRMRRFVGCKSSSPSTTSSIGLGESPQLDMQIEQAVRNLGLCLPQVVITGDQSVEESMRDARDLTPESVPPPSESQIGDPAVRRRGIMNTIRRLVRQPAAIPESMQISPTISPTINGVNARARRERRRSLLNIILSRGDGGGGTRRRSSDAATTDVIPSLNTISQGAFSVRPQSSHCGMQIRRFNPRVVPSSTGNQSAPSSVHSTPAVFLTPVSIDHPTSSGATWEYLGAI